MSAALSFGMAIALCGCGRTDESEKPRTPVEELRDRAMDYWPSELPRRASAWLEKRKAASHALLAGKHFDVLVVPLQVVDFGFSRAIRSLMSAKVAFALNESGEGVADPYLVADALGDGQRQYLPEDVFRLAREIGATRVLQGYVGHDQRGTMRVVWRLWESSNADWSTHLADPEKQDVITGIAFTDEHPAIEKFDELIPRVVAFAGGHASAAAVGARSPHVTALPPDPLSDSTDALDPAVAATHFQLLGTMAPVTAERVRERFFEKSLIAIDRMAPDSPDYRALKARAFMNLEMRPAALDILGDARSDAEREVAAALDGNLSDVADLVGKLDSDAERIFATANLNELRRAYGLYDAAVAASDVGKLNLPEPWRALFQRRMADWDVWRVPDYDVVKTLLDRAFPLPGFTFDDVSRGAQILGVDNGHAVELAAAKHIERLRQQNPAVFCCAALGIGPSPRDYVDLLEAAEIANLLDATQRLTSVKGLPQEGLDFLDGIDGVYHDHPQLTLARAQALVRVSEQAEPTARSTFDRQVFELTENLVLWEQGQTSTSNSALAMCWNTQGGYIIPNLYTWDLPYRDGYSLERRMVKREIADQIMDSQQQMDLRLKYTRTDFEVLQQMVTQRQRTGDAAGAEMLEKTTESRFRGSPDRFEWMVSKSVAGGNTVEAEARLREAIAAIPDYWSFYKELADSLARRGAYDDASSVFESYPSFKQIAGNRVAVSNGAFEAASTFYWRGDLVHARRWLELSAGLNTGSDASLASAVFLLLMERQYEGAAAVSRARAARYGASRAYRDYLALLYLLGYPTEASQAFELLIPQQGRELALWEAAMVGQRMARMTDAALLQWALEDNHRHFGGNGRNAATYLLRAAITDRVPSTELVDGIAALEGPWEYPKASYERVMGPEYYDMGNPMAMPKPRGSVDGIAVDGPSTTIAAGFRALDGGDVSAAFARFDSAARLHRAGTFTLPYYMLAAVKTGHGDDVMAQITGWDHANLSFDYLLARAVHAALARDRTAALADLKRAFDAKPYTENRAMYPAYEYADVCERIWKETHDDAYRRLAVDWAGKYQSLQPWSSWAYAIESELATDKAAGASKLRYAMYLDADSPRLAGVSPPARAKIEREIKESNPFASKARPTNAPNTPL